MGDLREPFASLAREIADTFTGVMRERKSDSDYPDGLYALHHCIEVMLRKYDVKLRPVPLDRADIQEPPPTCPVCMKPLGDTVAELRRPEGSSGPRRLYAHPACVNYPPRKP